MGGGGETAAGGLVRPVTSAAMESDVTLYANPACSKSRAAAQLLRERAIPHRVRDYLAAPLDAGELGALCTALGDAEARSIVRYKAPLAAELGLADADRDRRIAALVAHPELLERPIVQRGARAVIARPPERLAELW